MLTSTQKTICQMYGHCYCSQRIISGIIHKECCKCTNREAAEKNIFPSLRKERDLFRRHPARPMFID